MVTALDVDTNRLMENVANKLKAMKIEKPAFVGLVKTGSQKDRPPEQEDFWYVRCASIMRHIYVRGSVGTNKLRRHYGGRKSRGVRPEHHRQSGGNTIRKAMQQLEKAGLLARPKTGGRKLTAKGQALLDKAAKEVARTQE
jgi:small subunit ribosomal protein S19e